MPEQIPYSREAEEALVGAVLKWPDDFESIDIESGDFHDLRHRLIWETFITLRRKGQTIDDLAVSEQLKAAGKLEEAGGFGYLLDILDRVPFGHNPETSAAIVRDKSRRRSLLKVASEMAKTAYADAVDLESKTGEFMAALAEASRVKTGAVHWSKFISELFDEINERAADPKDYWGIETGFKDFDKATGGLQPGESLILSGKPGVGKTMLATQMCAQMAERGIPGAIYSLEMKGQSVVRRVLSARSKIAAGRMKSGHLRDADWPKIGGAIEIMESWPIYMSDYPDWTTTGLRADLSRLKSLYNIQWFMFDYMLLAGDARGEKEWERTGVISRAMKLICRYLDITGIVIHSMEKGGLKDGLVPDQSNLRGSAQVSFDADVIGFLTEFQPVSKDDQFISAADRLNMRTFWFGKGREMENPQKYFHLVKINTPEPLPLFGDYKAK